MKAVFAAERDLPAAVFPLRAGEHGVVEQFDSGFLKFPVAERGEYDRIDRNLKVPEVLHVEFREIGDGGVADFQGLGYQFPADSADHLSAAPCEEEAGTGDAADTQRAAADPVFFHQNAFCTAARRLNRGAASGDSGADDDDSVPD